MKAGSSESLHRPRPATKMTTLGPTAEMTSPYEEQHAQKNDARPRFNPLEPRRSASRTAALPSPEPAAVIGCQNAS